MSQELFNKYINGSCSDKELEKLHDWLNSSSSRSLRKFVSDDWRTFVPANMAKEGEYDDLLHKIHHQINLNETRGQSISLYRRVLQVVTRVAALLFIPLLSLFSYILYDNARYGMLIQGAVDSIEVVAPMGARTVVEMCDGTTVNLNYGSKIKYPRIFTGDTRDVKLDGEAYFNVAHDASMPLVVETSGVNIKVLGTKFNVQAYADEPFVATTLVEGKVALNNINGDQPLLTLKPGDRAVMDKKSGHIDSFKCNVDNYISWMNGVLLFDNKPISEIVTTLSRIYNVDIEVDEALLGFTYTLTFVNDPLLSILEIMSTTTPIKYTISPRRRMANNSYSKQLIKIEKAL